MRIPDTDRLIITATRNDVAIRAERDRPYPVSMPAEFLEEVTCFAIPNAYYRVFTATSKQGTIKTKSNGPDLSPLPL